MNILISANSKFLVPTKVLLYSLYKTQTDKIKIFFLNISCSQEEVHELKILAEHLNFDFFCLGISSDNKAVIQQKALLLEKDELAIETYARLFAPIMLHDLDRILWLDADCLVQKDLKEFYYQDLHGKYIAACDHSNWNLPDVPESLYPRKSHGEHFNAGVILFDLNQCRKIKGFQDGNIQKVILEFSGNYFDQGILNFLIPPNRVLWSDPLVYNCSINQNWNHGLKDNPIQWKLYPQASILHYCSILEKPWNLLTSSDYRKRKYWLKSYLELQQFLSTFQNNEESIKISVYTICKNEISYISDYLDNVKSADYICLLDTGSTDGTWEFLVDKQKSFGNNKLIIKQQIFDNFRFDVARNESMKLIPKNTDLCICMDIDERLSENWRESIQKTFHEILPQIDTPVFGFDVPFIEYKEGEIFRYSESLSIHSYSPLWTWKGAVHEIMRSPINPVFRDLKYPVISHYPSNDLQIKQRKKDLYDSLSIIRNKEEQEILSFDYSYSNIYIQLYENIQNGLIDETLDSLEQKIKIFEKMSSQMKDIPLENKVLLNTCIFILKNKLEFSSDDILRIKELFDLLLLPKSIRSEKQQNEVIEKSNSLKKYKDFDKFKEFI